jgi:hypothetical protein
MQLFSFLKGSRAPSVAAQIARDKHKSSPSSSQGRHRDGKGSSSGGSHRKSSRPHSGHKDGSHQKSRFAQSQQFTDLSLLDLDYRYNTFRLAVKPGCTVSKMEARVRMRPGFAGTSQEIPAGAEIRFYGRNGKELHGDDRVVDQQKLWYRVVARPHQTEFWKFTHDRDDTNGRLDSDLTNQLIRAVETGATFGDLRNKIASYMNINDPNRILVYQKNGMRPSLTRANSWKVAQVRTKWLCTWLSIDVAQEGRFIVLRGLGRDHIYQPHPQDAKDLLMNVRELKQWMEYSLFKNIVGTDEKDFRLKWQQIALYSSGSLARDDSHIVWGSHYDFELPTDAAEIFSDKEADFLPASEPCLVCGDDKKPSDFPVRITALCKHKPNLCKECHGQWIRSGMDTFEWDKIKCPDCSELLNFEDIKRYAPADVFARYDKLATRSALRNMKNFRWCLSTTCESGQIHDESCAKFKCVACSARHCVRHNVPWHSRETCEDYDKRNKQRRKNEKASEDTVKKITKKCPSCNRDVHKFTGCNHITCEFNPKSDLRVF